MSSFRPKFLLPVATVVTLGMAFAQAFASGVSGIENPHRKPFRALLVQSTEIDMRPASELSESELTARINRLMEMLQNGNEPEGVPVRRMIGEASRELAVRRDLQRGGVASQPLEPLRPAPGVRPRKPEIPPQVVKQPPQRPEKPQRIERVERVQPVERPRDEERVRPRIPRGDSVAETAARDARSPQALTDAELRQRISGLSRILETARMERRTERQLQDIIASDRAELDRRIGEATGVDVDRFEANDEARRLLDDRRPASRLSEVQLRERIQRIRAVLATGEVGPRLETRLRDRLAQDRDQLRAIVAAAEDERDFRNDRAAARDELRRAQRERRRDLENRRNVIIIDNRRRAPSAGNIPLAEARDYQIEEQLTAPPLRRIERRFTLDEYRRNPSLRSIMPGVEIDTVKFGFNEDFLREGEILKLERIGAIIERIVAGNPDEIFLIEGHTDLVGSDAYNQNLSFRRAAAVRDALLQYFYIEPGNLEIVGYGEQFPRIPVEYEEPENRRATLRRITPLLLGSR